MHASLGATLRMPVIALLVAVTLMTACGPAPGTPTSSAVVPAPERPSAPKVLTLGLQKEIGTWGEFQTSAGGGAAAPDIGHDSLITRDHTGDWAPKLAVEIPSVEKGTWVIFPDGAMELTWRIHPNVKWHDGTPFTTADLLFSHTVYTDKELPSAVASSLERIQSVSAPDPYTLVARFPRIDVRGYQAFALMPLPRHLLENLYQTNKAEVPQSPYLGSDFVGLGPYRMVRWDSGVQMEFTRFDDYYRGRPPLDRIILRFIRDPNAQIANIIAGAVDVVIPPGVDVDAALSVKQRWEGTGNRVIMEDSEDFSWVQLSFRPDVIRTPSAWLNRDVRAALYHAIDRPTLTQVMMHGLAPIADSWFPPAHPLRPQVEDAIPQYPYDVNRAQQLLTQAGWTRGADGVLVEAQTGERFLADLWANEALDFQRSQAIIAEFWKAVGVQAAVPVISGTLAADRRNEVLVSGPRVGTVGLHRFLFDGQLHTRETASDANRWGGRNRGAYSNPAADAVLDRLSATVDVRDRVPLYRDVLRLHMGDVPIMPLYWDVQPALALASVKGPVHSGKQSTWNIYAWDKE